MNNLPTIDASGFARDPIADGIATLDFHPWAFERHLASQGSASPERYLGQLLSIVRGDVRENAPDAPPLPPPTGDVWQDREAVVASLKSAKRSPGRYLADAERLLDFAAHVGAMESRAVREGIAGDAGLTAFIAERRASGDDPLALFVAVRQRADVPADESLRRLFLAARERCERARDFVSACGPIPSESRSPGAIAAEIGALRRWIVSAAALLRRRSGDGRASSEAPVLLTLADAARRVSKTKDAIRRAVDRGRLGKCVKPGDGKTYVDRNELDRLYGIAGVEIGRSAN